MAETGKPSLTYILYAIENDSRKQKNKDSDDFHNCSCIYPLISDKTRLFYNMTIKIEVFGTVDHYVNKAADGGVVLFGVDQHFVIHFG